MRFAAKWLKPYDLPLTALAFGLVALYVAIGGRGFPLDDSWIHQTYARNLALNGEWAFLAGVPSAASTSPLYTALLAVGYALRIDVFLWTHTLGALTLALTAVVAARMGDRIPSGWRYTGWLSGLAVLATWHLTWAAASGMETLLFSALGLVMMALAWRESDAQRGSRAALWRGVIFGVVSALTVSTRPEGLLLAGLLGLAVLVSHSDQRGTGLAWAAGAAVGFAVFITPYLLLNLQLAGGLLPNTSAAKQAEYAPVLAQMSFPALYFGFLGAIIVGGQALLLPGIAFYVWRTGQTCSPRAATLYLMPLIWAAALIALYALRLPMYSQHGRYVIPALPALAALGAAGTVMLVRAARYRRWTRLASLVLAASTVITFALFAVFIGPATLKNDLTVINGLMVVPAEWLRDNLPPEAGLLAAHDIGAVGYFAPRPLIDTAGLITPEIVPIITDPDAVWAFLEARGAAYLLAMPDLIPGGDANDPRLCEIYTTPTVAQKAMRLYALNWDGRCIRED